jgi:predicted transcriptional regulator
VDGVTHGRQATPKKRERLQVIYDILKTVSEHRNSIKPTPLLRKSQLSSSSFSEYYSELVSKGFVKEVVDEEGQRYITLTDKGFTYLEKYRMIRGFIDEFEL